MHTHARTHTTHIRTLIRTHTRTHTHAQNVSPQVVTSLADPSCNIIFGAVVDDSSEGVLSVTIIATGFSDKNFEEKLLSGRKPASGRRAAEQAAQVRVRLL